MKKTILFFTLTLLFFSCKKKSNTVLTIATAANMQFAIKELTQLFSQKTGIDYEVIISSSGKLTAQIQKGAPFDIFISANMKYPNQLFQKGFTHHPPQIYAYGKLVLWTMKKEIKPSLDILTNKKIKHIALPNPKTAPYGEAVIALLQHQHIFEKIEKKLVFGESIAQTNQFISSQAAEIGFTSKSIVLSKKMKNKGTWIALNSDIYPPIAQGIVLLKNRTTHQTEAQQFLDFIFSKKAKEILEKLGYES